MYMYHFVNTTGWGECYTVMSNNKIEARIALKNYLDKINGIYNVTLTIREENDDTFSVRMVAKSDGWEKLYTYQTYQYNVNDVIPIWR